MKYLLKIPLGRHKAGEILETDSDGDITYYLENSGSNYLLPHDIALMVHAGMLEEVKEEKWKPKMDEKYWYIDLEEFAVEDTEFSERRVHEDGWKNNNCFPTREKAEIALEKVRQALTECK